jgi:hypothetical protein
MMANGVGGLGLGGLQPSNEDQLSHDMEQLSLKDQKSTKVAIDVIQIAKKAGLSQEQAEGVKDVLQSLMEKIHNDPEHIEQIRLEAEGILCKTLPGFDKQKLHNLAHSKAFLPKTTPLVTVALDALCTIVSGLQLNEFLHLIETSSHFWSDPRKIDPLSLPVSALL